MMFKVILLVSLAVLGANAGSSCQAPGTTITTTTTSTVTTTVSAAGSGVGGASGSLLNGRERELIRSTWELARKRPNVAPHTLFKFLQAHPEYQKLFSLFPTVPQSELLTNGNFLGQAYTILAGLNVVIQSLGSQELVAQELSNLGVAHFNRGTKVYMFEQFGKILIDVIEEELGGRFNAEAREAWQNGYRALVAGISKSLKKEKDVVHPITGLTPGQIEDVRRSWEPIRAERAAISQTIFKQIFSETPRAQKAFPRFGDVSLADLDGNAAFVEQTTLVADRLDNMIATLDNTLQITGQVEYMGHSHKPRGIDRQRFEDFTSKLYVILASKGVSAHDIDSWKSVLGVVVDKIAKVMN